MVEENKFIDNKTQKNTDSEEENTRNLILEEEINRLSKSLQQSQEKEKENYELFIRERAEIENIKKRTQREILNIEKYALKKIFQELILIIDSIESCIKTKEKYQEEIKIIHEMLIEILKKHDVKKILIKENDILDPSKHEVIQIIESENETNNKIKEIFQNGYIMHEHVLRYSKVSVYKNLNN